MWREPWHALPVSEALERHDTSRTGLSSEEAAERLERHGPNRLPQPRTPSRIVVFLRQFRDPLIYVLLAAASISFAVGETTDAAFIGVVLLLNAVIGGYQEWQAEQSTLALQGLIRTHAVVRRDGEAIELDSTDVVPGDIVVLEPGNRVPADVRLLSTDALEVDESPLTGESIPVLKNADWWGVRETAVGDRLNVAYAGTTVTRGRGTGVVVATGMETEVGEVAEHVSESEAGKPPLTIRMERFTRVVGAAVVVAAAFAGVIGVLVQGYAATEMFLFGVALAVSAVPEGLPVSLTVALGIATNRMARVGVIVRELVAVEGLGSCTLIATDKTGTLTSNELTVKRVWMPDAELTVTGEGYVPDGRVLQDDGPLDPEVQDDAARLARAAVLCNEAGLHQRDGEWRWSGDPTDVALLSFAHKLGWRRDEALENYPQVNQIPFEPEHRYAATYHEDGGGRVYVKGAPERVLEMCSTAEYETGLRDVATELARDGYRVLAFAEGDAEISSEEAPPEPSDLDFLGFVCMIDPLRDGVVEAVRDARRAGVEVSMVTGDHPETALAIARELGLAENRNEVMTGAELDDVPPERLGEVVRGTRVFARVSPEQKLRVVKAAREAGDFVAVTGDGVNDAPALRTANVGISMGRRGTDVARDASQIVLSDDDFSSIVSGIREGRIAYDNVRKVIYLLVSTGSAEVVLVLLSLLLGLPLPLLPAQLLWLNLVTNGIQDVALAFEPEEGDVLDRAPRDPKERIFDRLMIERVVVAATVMGGVGFAVFAWLLGVGWSEPMARNALLLLMVLFENVHIGNSRSEVRSIFRLSPLKNPVLLVGAMAAFGIHFAALYFPPAQAVLETVPVEPIVFVGLGLTALVLAAAMELHKLSWRWRVNKAS